MIFSYQNLKIKQHNLKNCITMEPDSLSDYYMGIIVGWILTVQQTPGKSFFGFLSVIP